MLPTIFDNVYTNLLALTQDRNQLHGHVEYDKIVCSAWLFQGGQANRWHSRLVFYITKASSCEFSCKTQEITHWWHSAASLGLAQCVSVKLQTFWKKCHAWQAWKVPQPPCKIGHEQIRWSLFGLLLYEDTCPQNDVDHCWRQHTCIMTAISHRSMHDVAHTMFCQ